MGVYSFKNKLAVSQGTKRKREMIAIKKMIPGCIDVLISKKEDDINGTDYWALLRGGRKISIDAKRRECGCSKYWGNEEELALETYSVLPTMGNSPKTGWTLDESKNTELVLFSFDIKDSDKCFLESFQLLRIAFRRNAKKWMHEYKVDIQTTAEGWQSQCVFVPYSVVSDSITEIKSKIVKTISVQAELF